MYYSSSAYRFVAKVGPCGSEYGEVREMDVTRITRIVKIGVRHGGAIDAITVHYLRNSIEENTGRWGGGGGVLSEFHLSPCEYIMAVKGHMSNFNGAPYVMRSLKFETNLGTYGPYGREEGIPFQLPAIVGEIIGFHGRSGTYLNALGVYIKVVVPRPVPTPTVNERKAVLTFEGSKMHDCSSRPMP